MKLTFRLNLDYDLEEGYRHLQVLIYGVMNYVGVLVKEDWTVIPVDELEEEDGVKKDCDYRTGETPWKMGCYHSSWGRTDGIDHILNEHNDRINGLDTLDHWYGVVDLSDDLLHELTTMMTSQDYTPGEFMKGVLQFEKDGSGKIVEKINVQ
jgi:hypothetical protein